MSLRERAWVGVAVLCALGWLARPLSSEAVIGALFGAAIGAVISWYFYRQASDELKDVHDRIVRMLGAISGGTEVKVTQDERGNTVLTFVAKEKPDSGITDQLDVTDSVQVSKPSDEDPKNGR